MYTYSVTATYTTIMYTNLIILHQLCACVCVGIVVGCGINRASECRQVGVGVDGQRLVSHYSTSFIVKEVRHRPLTCVTPYIHSQHPSTAEGRTVRRRLLSQQGDSLPVLLTSSFTDYNNVTEGPLTCE